MSRQAWAYVIGVILAGAIAGLFTLPPPAISRFQWLTFVALLMLATIAQLFKAEAPDKQLYYATTVFLFAGVILLNPFLFVVLVLISHLIEWAKERLAGSPYLRAWYGQPFNIAIHIIAGFAARWTYTVVLTDVNIVATWSPVVAACVAAVVYVLFNHLFVGQALVLSQGVSWRESGVLEPENVATDLINLLLGYVVAVLWELNPWLVLPALSPLVLIYRALQIPQLQKQARTDGKTGLWNAHHFAEVFQNEVHRANRYARPLALIMADLDLLRNINNTYGHLAGDVVLAEIGRIIRETIREYDFAGRFGGEEFAIALPETSHAEASIIAERLRLAVENAQFTVATSNKPIRATMSLGVSALPEDATEPDDLIHEADVAVYQAKLKGRNQVVCASNVPHFTRLDTRMMPEDRIVGATSVVFTPRPTISERSADRNGDDDEPAANGGGNPTGNEKQARSEKSRVKDAAPQADKGESVSPMAILRAYPEALTWLFVGGVVALGIGVTTLAFKTGPAPDWSVIGLLAVLTVMAEYYEMHLFGEGTTSVAVAIVIAAAVTSGVPGVTVMGAAIAGVHYLRRRPHLHQTAFNWATHVIAGTVTVAATNLVRGADLSPQNLPLLALTGGVAAMNYFAINTGLVASVISLSQGERLVPFWREHYRWLAEHYLVLGLMGLFMGVAYHSAGLPAIVVFMLPVFMMRYAQKQYVERAEKGVQELKRMNEELAQANREVLSASRSIRQLNDELFLTLSKIVDARDPYVHSHAAKVADYATAIASELQMPADRVEGVRQSAFLHDIGKVALSEQVLHKPSSLSNEEYEYIKAHVTLGAEFLETSAGLRRLVPFVRHHHERWDGGGYPDGLAGQTIPLEARILAVCDAVEAMASDRPYHAAMSAGEIIGELRHCAGTQFDPAVVEAFIRIVNREGQHFIVNSAREVALSHTDEDDLLYRFNNGWLHLDGQPQDRHLAV